MNEVLRAALAEDDRPVTAKMLENALPIAESIQHGGIAQNSRYCPL
jgi:hypothetical protein